MGDKAAYARPGALMRRVIGPTMIRLGRYPVRTVEGRTSGRPRSVPIGEPLEWPGRSCLLSGRGKTQWILNLRAAGCGTLRMNGRTRAFTATEIAGSERDQVIAAYREKWGKGVEALFEQFPAAEDHPTFRLDFEPDLD
jgi:deazaflavin-dependent oxidoreductase (nitroreductase family)